MRDLDELFASPRSMLDREQADGVGDVPVFVDARIDANQITRCSYLIIETEQPDPRFGLRIGGQVTPLLLLRLSAVVMGPFGGDRFTGPELFDDLFRRVESNKRLSVESSDLWLPTFLFGDREIAAGDVYRVDRTLFAAALRYRQGGVDPAEFSREADRQMEKFRFSEVETMAYRSWHRQVMAEPAIDKDPDLELPDREVP